MKILSRRSFVRATGAASLGALAASDRNAAAGPARPLNLLFVMTDQQRWDAMSCAGNTILDTPNLDRLAREGVRFENAYTNCPICVPARAVMLTGHSIHSVRVPRNKDCEHDDGADVPTFDNLLARAGYNTEYHGKWHTPYKFAATYRNPVRQTGKQASGADIPGTAAAYRTWLEEHVPPREARAGELIDAYSRRPYRPDPLDWRFGQAPDAKGAQSGTHGCLDVPAEYSRTAFTALAVLDALDRIEERPFSLTCSFGPPHPPLVVPTAYHGMYPAAQIPVPASNDDPMDNSPYSERAASEEMQRYRNGAHVRQMISNYYGMVKEVDDWVGRLLDKLDALELADTTLVIFTSDHGEMLGDHGMHSKMVLYEGAARIPLLMRLPSGIRPGAVVTRPVSHIDLFPTILDYLGQPPATSEGRSLRSLIDGERDDGPDYCVSEWGSASGPTLMTRTEEWKLICAHNPRSPSVDALYNLKEDPLELHNLIGKDPGRERHTAQAEAIRARLIEWLAKVGSPRLEDARGRALT